jgi:hypothetical protein
VVEIDLQLPVVHLGAHVVDHVLAGEHLHALLLADAQPHVDRGAVLDPGEVGDVAGLGGAGTVVAAAGERESGRGNFARLRGSCRFPRSPFVVWTTIPAKEEP